MTSTPPGPEAPAIAAEAVEAGAGRDPLYARGVALVLAAGCFWSIAGVLIRAIEQAGDWQILFYRSLSLVVALACVLVARHRSGVLREFRRAGLGSVVGGLGLSVGFAGFVYAINNTTVANAVFILSVSPLSTALLARIVLGEDIRRATWIAMTFAFVGLGIMVVEGIQAGALVGNLASLAAVLGFSVFAVSLRRGRQTDMLPTALIAGLFASIGAAFAADGLAVTARDLGLCTAMGVVQLAAGLVLFVKGSRHVPAAELALLALTEVILAPVLVWLVYGEVPGGYTVLGGAIVLSAIAGQALSGMRRKPPPIGAV